MAIRNRIIDIYFVGAPYYTYIIVYKNLINDHFFLLKLGADGVHNRLNDVAIGMKDGSMFGALLQQVFSLKHVPFWVRPQEQQIQPRYPDPHTSVYIRTPICEHFISHSPIELHTIHVKPNPLYKHVPMSAKLSLGTNKHFVAKSFQLFDVNQPHTHFQPCGRIYVATPKAAEVYTALLEPTSSNWNLKPTL